MYNCILIEVGSKSINNHASPITSQGPGMECSFLLTSLTVALMALPNFFQNLERALISTQKQELGSVGYTGHSGL